jgi:hypothetical protein
MAAGMVSARKQPVVVTLSSEFQPGSNRVAGWLCDLEGNRSSGLLLDDGGSKPK